MAERISRQQTSWGGQWGGFQTLSKFRANNILPSSAWSNSVSDNKRHGNSFLRHQPGPDLNMWLLWLTPFTIPDFPTFVVNSSITTSLSIMVGHYSIQKACQKSKYLLSNRSSNFYNRLLYLSSNRSYTHQTRRLYYLHGRKRKSAFPQLRQENAIMVARGQEDCKRASRGSLATIRIWLG